MTRPDVLVIGAGIVGAAVAYVLTRDGHDVEVVDAGCVAGGTTAAGMGHIVVMDDSEAQLALTAYSRGLLAALAPELDDRCELDACGTLWIAEDDAQIEAMRGKSAWYEARGVATELLDAAQLAEAEPNLRPGLAGALRVPDDAVVYPPGLAAWLLDQARAAGARVRLGAAVQRIDAHEVTIAGSRHGAGHVVLAAGAAATRLVPQLPVVPRKGHLVITDRYPGFCRHQLVELGYLASAHTMTAASVAFNIQPRRTGQLLIGSSRELVDWDASIERDVVHRMLARATSFMPRLAGLSAIRTWTGFRPATADKLPLIGAWEDIPGLWVAAGHEGLGITTALGTAAVLADLMAERTPAIDAVPYAPARAFAEA
jgi:glycine/D-amino acid oxidase-like deaminating enzyme